MTQLRLLLLFLSVVLAEYKQRQEMSNEETRNATASLHKQQLDGQPIFPLRPKPHQPQIQDCEIRRLGDLALGVSCQLDQR